MATTVNTVGMAIENTAGSATTGTGADSPEDEETGGSDPVRFSHAGGDA